MRSALLNGLFVLLFFAGALAVSVVFAATLFGVPAEDVPAIATLLAGVGGGLGLPALLLTRPAVLGRVWGQLVGASLISSLLLAGMILAAAKAMFISGHDLAVLLTMLLFATLFAVGFSLYWAAPMARRIERVRTGTEQLASGELEDKLPVEGKDEISGLAADFNRMATALREKEEHERRLEQSRRDLIAAVSHDLRTPLSATQALIEAVADDVAEDPHTAERYLRSAQGEISHLTHLVEDLFEIARIDAGLTEIPLEEASLYDLISDTLSGFRPHSDNKGIHLTGEVSGEVDPVLMNPPRLQRVLHNLLDNALRHTSPEGSIFLRAEPLGEVVEVEVSDTGEGIAPENLPCIFEHSFRGEESRTRTENGYNSDSGLGLAIARSLVEAHGGEIWVESPPGEGSRFRFTLKRA